MKFYELGETPEDAVKLHTQHLALNNFVPPEGETPEEKTERLLNAGLDLDCLAETAAQQWLDGGDGDSYKGWPRIFIILNDDGTELGRRRVNIDWDPTFIVDEDKDPLYSTCDICGNDVKLGEKLLECPKCGEWGGTGCCMMGGRGVLCCKCEEA